MSEIAKLFRCNCRRSASPFAADNQNQKTYMNYNVDLVLCIDATASMGSIIEAANLTLLG